MGSPTQHEGDDELDEPYGGRHVATAPPPVRGPVAFEAADTDEAIAIARDAIGAGAAIVGADVDAYTFEQLATALIPLLQSGACETGLPLGAVCKTARVGRGRVGQHYTPAWERVADLAVRLVLVGGHRRVLYEELFTIPARVGREHHGLGTDHRRQAAHAMHFAGTALGAADRHCASTAIPLLTATRDDRTAPEAAPERIASFERESGRPLPATIADHVRELLDFERGQRRAVAAGASTLGAALQRLAIDPRQLVAGGFAAPVFLDAMPFGAPVQRARSSSGLLLPGRDPDVLAALHAAGRPALADAGPLPTTGDARRDLADQQRRGLNPLPWLMSSLSDDLGAPRTQPYGVEMLWSPSEQLLVRRDVGAGARTRSFKAIGFAEANLPTAVSIVERAMQEWPRGCLKRAVRSCAPGLLKTPNVASQATWRALLRVADAALVEADRRRMQREARG